MYCAAVKQEITILDVARYWQYSVQRRFYKNRHQTACVESESHFDVEKFTVMSSDLSDVLQHGHASDLLLDGSVGVDLAPKLGSVGCMVHLMKKEENDGHYRTLICSHRLCVVTALKKDRRFLILSRLLAAYFGGEKC